MVVYYFWDSKFSHNCGCLNSYKINKIAAGREVKSCKLWDFEGFMLNFEWLG
jgi:hypothetical protein